jgi:hypothetical protein
VRVRGVAGLLFRLLLIAGSWKKAPLSVLQNCVDGCYLKGATDRCLIQLPLTIDPQLRSSYCYVRCDDRHFLMSRVAYYMWESLNKCACVVWRACGCAAKSEPASKGC